MSILDKASLIQIPSGYKSTKLYSLRPINGDGDFTFSRSSSGTRVNSEGLIEVASVLGSEEIVNGDFATDSDWTLGSNTTIANGALNFNNATSNTDQSLTTTNTKIYKVVFTISNYVSGSVRFRFTGTANINGISRSTNGTFTQYITATANNSIFRFAANAFNGSIDNVSVKEVFENDVPRLDYSGGASCASLLLESQRTNLITYSEDLTNPVYISGGGSGSSVVRTANYGISPDGTQNATRIQITRGSVYGEIYNRVATSIGQDYTFSFYAKALSGSPTLATIYDGSYQNIVTFTDEWVKYTYTYTAVTTLSGFNFTTWTGLPTTTETADLLIWGVQIEQGSYPTSYIPSNSGSQTTRSADVCNNAGTSATFNSTEGVLFAEIAALTEVGDGTTRLSISDGSQDNNVTIGYSATNTLRTIIRSGASNQALMTSSQTITNYLKVGVKYKANDFALWVNGVEVATDTSGLAPVGLSELSFDRGDAALPFYGKTKQLMVFDEALSDEELSDLTGQVNLSFNNLATFYGYNIL